MEDSSYNKMGLGWLNEMYPEIPMTEMEKLKAENARLREALEWYAWYCEPTLIQRSDNSGTLVLIEDKEKALACRDEDKFIFGTKARKALKGGE